MALSVYEVPWGYGEEEPPVSPLLAKGVIEDHSFPTSADVDVQAGWSIIAHNIGTEGRFATGIVNVAGNPGDITIIWEGSETVIPPGNYYRIHSVSPEPYCMKINTTGGVKFATAGSYSIKLWALHEGAPDEWFYDDERILTVNVTGVTPPEWPVTESFHAFDNYVLKGNPFSIIRKETRTFEIYDIDKILEGKLRYSIKWTAGGSIPPPEAMIYVKETRYVLTPLVMNQPVTGKTDLISVGSPMKVKIEIEHTLLSSPEVVFDVWIDIGYTEEPSAPPQERIDWAEWLEKNKYWMALSVLGVGLILMYRPSPPSPPVIIYQPPATRK